MKYLSYNVIVGFGVFIVGIFYIGQGEAIVGIKGFSKSIRGMGAILVGSAYCIGGIILMVTLAIESNNAIPIQLGAIAFLVFVTLVGYFLGE
jgi:hypothetical protein